MEAISPEAFGQVSVRGRMGELDRARDAELCESREVGSVEALGVLDSLAGPSRLPGVARRCEGIERVTIRTVADRVDRNRPACLCGTTHDVLELLTARDLNT